MKAVLLCAGQGRRLRPWTDTLPKCLLPVRGDEPVLEVQLQTLAACGIEDAIVCVGFGAERVERYLARRAPAGIRARSVFNPFYGVSDNLATCWLLREHLVGRRLLVNGDSLFEPAALRRLLAAPEAPLTLAIHHKDAYDDDDMKVSLARDGGLVGIGKRLDPRIVDAESIGLLRLEAEGCAWFRRVLDRLVRSGDATRRWYLSVVEAMAQEARVATLPITDLWWGELDSPDDLAALRAHFAARADEDKEPARAHRALFARV